MSPKQSGEHSKQDKVWACQQQTRSQEVFWQKAHLMAGTTDMARLMFKLEVQLVGGPVRNEIGRTINNAGLARLSPRVSFEQLFDQQAHEAHTKWTAKGDGRAHVNSSWPS